MLRKIALALALAAVISVCRADDTPTLDVVEHRLDNGLTLLVLTHRQAPVVSCSMVYRVGSVNEDPGYTGISHLLEHMMFKGTASIGTRDYRREKALLDELDSLHSRLRRLKTEAPDGGGEAAGDIEKRISAAQAGADSLVVPNELWEIYERNGGTGINAGTGRDMTSYYCSLPANRLELWMMLESDRMADAVFRQFYRERDVVLEERRLSIDDSPGGLLYERLFASAFIAHPYRWPVIGWESDVESISRARLESYYRRYYAPNNAVAVVVGDVDPDEVLRLAERYLGRVPAQPPPPAVVTVEPPQRGPRALDIAFDASPQLSLAFHKPSVRAGDSYVFEIIETILSYGRTSRFYSNIVEKKKLAVSVSGFGQPTQFPFLFIVNAVPRSPHGPDEVREAIWEELRRLSREPASDWEIAKAKNQLEAQFLRMLESTSGLASLIGMFEAIDRWEYLNGYLPAIRTITARDVMRVAAAYFKEDNCTTVTLQRP